MHEPDSPLLPPPGWYPAPGAVGERFWDGTSWTEQTRATAPDTTAAAVPRGPTRAAAPAPAPGWYPNTAGPGVRFWNGERWTETEVPVVAAVEPAPAPVAVDAPSLAMRPRSADRPPPVSESRRRRALRLGRVSLAMLRSDPRLVVFPVVSTLVSLSIGIVAVVISLDMAGGIKHARNISLTVGILASYPITFVTLFSSVALACTLGRLLAGESATAADGWRDARARAGLIAQWTLVVCTVGALLRVLEERLPLGGRLTAALAGLSWGLATLFAVPVIAYEQLGPGQTLRRSAGLFRQRWGAQVGGSLVIGLGTAAIAVPAVIVIVLGIVAGGPGGVLLIALGGGGLLALQAFSLTLTQVYRIFLYRDTVGAAGGGGPFAVADLDQPFRGTRGFLG